MINLTVKDLPARLPVLFRLGKSHFFYGFPQLFCSIPEAEKPPVIPGKIEHLHPSSDIIVHLLAGVFFVPGDITYFPQLLPQIILRNSRVLPYLFLQKYPSEPGIFFAVVTLRPCILRSAFHIPRSSYFPPSIKLTRAVAIVLPDCSPVHLAETFTRCLPHRSILAVTSISSPFTAGER